MTKADNDRARFRLGIGPGAGRGRRGDAVEEITSGGGHILVQAR